VDPHRHWAGASLVRFHVRYERGILSGFWKEEKECDDDPAGEFRFLASVRRDGVSEGVVASALKSSPQKGEGI